MPGKPESARVWCAPCEIGGGFATLPTRFARIGSFRCFDPGTWDYGVAFDDGVVSHHRDEEHHGAAA